MRERADGEGCRGSGERIQWYCRVLLYVSNKVVHDVGLFVPEYIKTFNFLVAMVVTLCVGAEVVRLSGLRVTCSRAESYNKHLSTVPSSFSMSKDTCCSADDDRRRAR
jgi:hypothetical protein